MSILRWDIEIDRIDIFHGDELLLQYQYNPRFSHIEALYHIFAYSTSHMKMGCIGLVKSVCSALDSG